jgi:hypothetical protein
MFPREAADTLDDFSERTFFSPKSSWSTEASVPHLRPFAENAVIRRVGSGREIDGHAAAALRKRRKEVRFADRGGNRCGKLKIYAKLY